MLVRRSKVEMDASQLATRSWPPSESVSRKDRIHGFGFGTVVLPVAAGTARLRSLGITSSPPSPSPMAYARRSHAFIRHFRGRSRGVCGPGLEQLRSRKLIHKGSSARPDAKGNARQCSAISKSEPLVFALVHRGSISRPLTHFIYVLEIAVTDTELHHIRPR